MFYHGSCTACLSELNYKLLPPKETNLIQEKGRKKNLDKVFFTKDLGLAKIYAGRSKQRFGGNPIIFRVIPMDEVECINDSKGATVYMSNYAFIERI